MPYDKPDYHRSGHGSYERSSQYSDPYDAGYEFDYDYDSDVLTDRGDPPPEDVHAFGRSYDTGDDDTGDDRGTDDPVDRDHALRRDYHAHAYGSPRRWADDEDYRPELDYDPDYQADEQPLSDHAQQFPRVEAARSAPSKGRPARAPRTGRRDTRTPPVRKRRAWLRWLVVGVIFVLGLVAVGAAVAYRYADSLLTGQQTQVGGTAVAEAGEPINILIVGSDSRAGLSGAQLNQTTEDVGGERTDTIMILHVDPEQKKAVLVSIPRDLRTEVNGDVAKINAAGGGGPSLMVRTVEETTGLDINHFVEVNFAGFLEVVDTVGGVRLCNNTGEMMIDKMAGLRMPTGCHNIKGDQALAFVRARHIDSDFGRIGRQQQFMRALLAKIGSAGNLINIPKMVTLANELSGTITTDQAFSASEAIRIARGMGSLSLDDVDMRTYPSQGRGPECEGCPAYVYPLPEAEILMQAIASGAEKLPPVGLTGEDNVTLANTTLRVVNGGDVQNAAADATEALEELGFTATVEGNTEAPIGPTTQVRYGENMPEEARLMRWLLRGYGVQVELVPADPETGPGPNSLTLVIGGNWQRLDGQTSGAPGTPTGTGPDAGPDAGVDATEPPTPEPGADLSGIGSPEDGG